MSLREKLIEAAAPAAFSAYYGEADDAMTPDDLEWLSVAEAVLDVILDTLEANAEEWGGAGNAWAAKLHDGWRSEDIIGYGRGHSDRHARALIAALRDTEAGEQ